MSHHSRSSSANSDEALKLFLDTSEKARKECPSPPPGAAATTTTTEDPVLASESTEKDRFKTMAAAIDLHSEALRRLLQDAQGNARGEENLITTAVTSPDQGEAVDKLKAEIEQLSIQLQAVRAELAVAQWQLREAGRVQTQAPNTFEATMTEVIEAVHNKWEEYSLLSLVTDPAKVIEDLRKRNKQLEEENKSLDRKGFMPKMMRNLITKCKALRQRNSELEDKLKQNERAKADIDKIADLEAEITKITKEKAELFKKQKSIFHLCKELKENQGHLCDLSEYKMNDTVFSMFEEFIRQKIAQSK
ncbi:hypothetical protein MCOR25_003255 [Pyricularia grisea]|nr:hypothetical protein MCOR25_003255 [Pyricularia grisea]